MTIFVLYSLLNVTRSSWSDKLFLSAVFLPISRTSLTALLPSCFVYTLLFINFPIGILHWILRNFKLSCVLDVYVRGAGGRRYPVEIILLFHFLPNLYVHSFSCPLLLLTSSLSSSPPVPAQCHTCSQVITPDPLLHFSCPTLLAHKHAAVCCLSTVPSSNFNSARLFLRAIQTVSPTCDVACCWHFVLFNTSSFCFFLSYALTSFPSTRCAPLFLLQYMSYTRISCPVNEAAACRVCVLADTKIYTVYCFQSIH